MTLADRARTPLILLIDDDDDVLSVLDDLVGALGYRTRRADSGAAGLAAAADSPDAVLLDIAMPGSLDGVQTLQALKDRHPKLPVIMITANADVAIAETTLRKGAFDYVMKPVEMARLRDVLTAAIMASGKLPP